MFSLVTLHTILYITARAHSALCHRRWSLLVAHHASRIEQNVNAPWTCLIGPPVLDYWLWGPKKYAQYPYIDAMDRALLCVQNKSSALPIMPLKFCLRVHKIYEGLLFNLAPPYEQFARHPMDTHICRYDNHNI